MAIGTTPLFSELSGSCGPVDFRTRRNNKIEIGKKRIPANPQSTEQTNTRNAYGRLHELWQNADWIDKTQYNNIAAEYDISPWNAFLMRHLPIMRLNPVTYWPFIEGTGNTLHDLTTNENHGTIYGATWEISNKYDIPQLSFDGVDDWCDVPHNTSLNISPHLSIFSILKPTLDHEMCIISKQVGGQSSFRTSLILPSSARFSVYSTGSGATGETSTPLHDPAKRTNITGVFDGDKNKIYLEDTLEITHDIPLTSIDFNTFNLEIGRNRATLTQYFKGILNSAAIFDYPLTQTPITRLNTTSKKFYGDYA